MAIIVKETGGTKFTPHPEGEFTAVCVDIVDHGMVSVEWKGQKKEQHKISVVFFCGEWKDIDDGRIPLTVRGRFTATLSPKGNLRPFLEGWRGRQFTSEELEAFDVEKLLHAPAYLNVQHVHKNGETYANIITCIRLPKGLQAPAAPADYVRSCDRVDEDGNGSRSPFDDDEDSDLPF